MKVFALTFAYNEHFLLPRWAQYYGSQLGVENLFVLDHGSSDLSTKGLGRVNIISVPRTPFDDARKSLYASYQHAALLQYYDAGFVVDADEFIVADPQKYKNLHDFASKTQAEALACVGLELCHIRSREPEYNDALPILFQRGYVVFDSWVCKRSFARKPVRFGSGGQTSDQPVVFDNDLYLIHLKNFDYKLRVVRQQVTAGWEYAGDFGMHARRPADYVSGIFEGFDARVSANLVSQDFNFQKEIDMCRERTELNSLGQYDFNVHGGFQSAELHLLPVHFRRLF